MSEDRTRLDDIVTLSNFPCGRKSQTILRKKLLETQNPSSTITQTREENSLHAFVSKAFGTLPVTTTGSSQHHDSSSNGRTVASSSFQKRTTRGELQQLERIKSKGEVVEDFQPESALTFCKHLGVSRYDIHKNMSDSLKSALEYEIEKVDVSKSKELLLDLLKSSFQFIQVLDLKSVFVTIVKKLGDDTPVEVLQLLASRSAKNPKELKYGDLLQSFSLDMKRMVWEADWDASVRPDGLPVAVENAAVAFVPMSDIGVTLVGEGGEQQKMLMLMEIVKPSIQAYLNHDSLRKDADLAYTTSIREKRVDTDQRRVGNTKNNKGAGAGAMSSTSSSVVAGMIASSLSGKLSALTKMEKLGGDTTGTRMASSNQEDSMENVPCLVLSALKETLGTRPKLLAAVLNILIAEHGKGVTEENVNDGMHKKVMNGADSLQCTLVSDILLTYGQLPRHYEDVRLLAQTLDKCVQIGIISDQAIGQIQQLLKSIFQQQQQQQQDRREKDPSTLVRKKERKQESVTESESANANATSSRKETAKNEAERQFELKLLRKIIKASVLAMKECDPQGLFLNPVTDDIAPGYSRVIQKMMCIRMMEEKAVNLKYESLDQYESDVQLMFQNCIKYNVGKDGSWFRGEARRQQKKWREEILTQAKNIYKEEMTKRKKQLDNAAVAVSGSTASTISAKTLEENKKKAILEQQRKLLMGNRDTTNKRKRLESGENTHHTNGNLIQPLAESIAKKRKKDVLCPSMPALASMLLSDPFVVRLLFDKVLRAIKNDVLQNKTIPADHGTMASVLQLIHIASLSRKVCAVRGNLFVIPDAGLMDKAVASDENGPTVVSEPFSILRKQVPRLSNLILAADMDKRIIGGDLLMLTPFPKSKPEEWKFDGSSNRILLDLVEGSLVHLLHSGISNDAVIVSQCSRFFVAIDGLSNGNMKNEKCFFVSLIHALLRYKAKLPHSIRDLVVKAWLGWFHSSSQEDASTMTSAMHYCFVTLLNEWASLGNLVLPVDTMIMWTKDAIHACEVNANDKAMSFSKFWTSDEENFRKVKLEYERMLKGMPEDRAMKWKESVGISIIS